MAQYFCQLVSEGNVHKRFFREGASEKDVLDGLEMFQWPGAPKGAEWEIVDVESPEFQERDNG